MNQNENQNRTKLSEENFYQKIGEFTLKSYGSALKLFSGVLGKAEKLQVTETVELLEKKLNDIDISRITETMNKLMNSDIFKSLLSVSHNLAYLDYLKRIQWPLFFVSDKHLEDKLLTVIEVDEEKSPAIIMEHFSDEDIRGLSDSWNECNVIKEERKAIFKESIRAYEMELYTLCVSSLVCQMSGIINDITALYNEYGESFNEEELAAYLKLIEETEEQKELGKLESEKTKLLGISKNLMEGFYFWSSFVLYMRDVIYTSDNQMSSSNQPCRNKICHGDQVNFGTKEHALKSILIIDALIKNANMSQKYLERNLNEKCEDEFEFY